MNNYLVKWEIDAYVETPVAAALKALEVQRNKESHALVFDVTDDCGRTTRVDLLTDDGLTADQLRQRHGPEHPNHHWIEWRNAVESKNTIRGYWDWVAAQIEESA